MTFLHTFGFPNATSSQNDYPFTDSFTVEKIIKLSRENRIRRLCWVSSQRVAFENHTTKYTGANRIIP